MGIEQFLLERAFNEGVLEGIKEAKLEAKLEAEHNKTLFFVKNLITETDFTTEKIASMALVSVAFVKKVKKKMKEPS